MTLGTKRKERMHTEREYATVVKFIVEHVELHTVFKETVGLQIIIFGNQNFSSVLDF